MDRQKRDKKQKRKNIAFAYSWSLPSLVLILLIVVFPIIYTGYISITNMNIYHWTDYEVQGFDNYKDALFVLDNGFISAVLMTIAWTVVNIVLQLVIAFLLASLLNMKKLKLRNIYKTLLIFPWAMPGYVSILLWKTGMFNSQFGLLNQWMQKMGFESVRWLNTDMMAFICCTVVNLWLALPFMITIIDGALQSVDKSFYESGKLDGATWIQSTFYITIPMIRLIIAPSVIITIFTTFKQFDVIYLLTQQVGSKSGANIHSILTYAYEKAFVTNNYGYSSAVSMIIFAMLVGFALIINMKPKEERRDG
jgi:arabinogalactan oligomer/maltooligosaccharide transport system permease protein